MGHSASVDGKLPNPERSIVTIDGEKAVQAHIPKTQLFVLSANDGADVGKDRETNVSPDYEQDDNKFTGKIQKVAIELV